MIFPNCQLPGPADCWVFWANFSRSTWRCAARPIHRNTGHDGRVPYAAVWSSARRSTGADAGGGHHASTAAAPGGGPAKAWATLAPPSGFFSRSARKRLCGHQPARAARSVPALLALIAAWHGRGCPGVRSGSGGQSVGRADHSGAPACGFLLVPPDFRRRETISLAAVALLVVAAYLVAQGNDSRLSLPLGQRLLAMFADPAFYVLYPRLDWAFTPFRWLSCGLCRGV